MSKVIHFEILADDPERACTFYEQVLGWTIQRWEGPQSYWLISTGDDGTPGIGGAIMERHFQQPVINTAEVDDLAAAMERVKTAGGAVVFGPNEIPGIGTHAYCTDTEGNMFGMLHPKEGS